MPSALENLIKILKLEQANKFNNKAVIGGMKAYAPNWSKLAHAESVKAEQHALVEEMLLVMADYEESDDAETREELATYMFERVTRRRDPLPDYEVPLEAAEVLIEEMEEEIVDLEDTEEDIEDAVEKPVNDHQNFLDALPDLAENAAASAPPKVEFVRKIPPKAAKPLRRKRTPLNIEAAIKTLQELNQPITTINGIGAAMAEKFSKLGIETLHDMLFNFPRRYDDYTHLIPLHKLKPFQMLTVIATVRRVHERVTKGNRKIFVATVSDGTATMDISFFNQPWLIRQLKPGMQVTFRGKTDVYLGKVTMNNPEWELVDQKRLQNGEIVPVYALTKGISSQTMRRLMRNVVSEWADKIPDHLPDSVIDRTEQVDLGWALRQIHQPEKLEYIDYARERFAFDELISLQLGVMRNRVEWQSQPAIPLEITDEWVSGFQAQLPFNLTGAQVRAINTIREDMTQSVPMNRLLQGDVGAGKTLVAAVTLAAGLLNGKQAALMAPTSILAEQHYQKLTELFAQVPGLEDTRSALLTGSLTTRQRQDIYDSLADGSLNFVIGTHALIEEGVDFQDLAVAVVDEQHRFGVEQRGSLRGKGNNPHLLVMSATPIPRTLALTAYADLDLTVLDEMPPGRIPIQTKLVTPDRRTKAYEFIKRKVLENGQQAYVIYPLVEASDKIDSGSAVEGFDYLQKVIFPEYKLGLMHGRLRPSDKEEVMAAFVSGETHILVSTSVIEVGVDVPNATAMIIEGSERFGLAQLHQFRGRVGRGDQQSYCMLISDEITERLQAIEDTTDGFKLAEKDWELRGAGDLLGLRQSGQGDVEISQLMNSKLVALAQQEAKTIYAEDPLLDLPTYALLNMRVQQTIDQRADVS